MSEDNLPGDLVGNELYLQDMELNNLVNFRTELTDYKIMLQMLRKQEKQLRNLRKSDRTEDLPEDVSSQIDTAHKKVNKALKAVGQRFEKEYNKDAFPWLKEVAE